MNTIASRTKTQKLTISALLASLALIFSYIEAILPVNPGIPGVKLGIANLVIIIALYYIGPKYAFTINIVRILIAGLLFNGLFGALYALSGAIVSFIVMLLLKKTNLFSTVGVSIAGGVAHNFGQLIVAAFLISTAKIFVYFPVLIFSGLISGAIIGVLAHLILRRLPS
ncbi:MAG: Gx transporter family protein [Bacillota bacterium]|nr:Gx transporter family protein [Bacillota bacterium]